jgi:DNA recombination protein RmuC
VIRAERDRAAAAADLERLLKEQQQQTLVAAGDVRREAARLARALSRTHQRGSWGEAELRRLVEAAGMLEKVHFDSQATQRTADAHLRPDIVIHLAGGRSIVVDAKAPLDALLQAADEVSNDYSPETLQRHAKALRDHVDALAKRDYSGVVAGSADHVVLYLPAESLLSLALAADPGLLDHAFGKRITLATPTTMMALLRSVAQYWRDEALAENAAKIRDEGIELHNRLGTMAEHLGKLGRSLDAAVQAFNGTVGSFETRVMPASRRFSELGLIKQPLQAPGEINSSPRNLRVAHLDLTEPRALPAPGEAVG